MESAGSLSVVQKMMKKWTEQSFPANFSAENGWMLRVCHKHFHIDDPVFCAAGRWYRCV